MVLSWIRCDYMPAVAHTLIAVLFSSASSLQVPERKFAFLVDADFVLPRGMLASLVTGHSGDVLRNMRAGWDNGRKRRAIVIPAYERRARVCPNAERQAQCAPDIQGALKKGTQCWMYSSYDVPATRDELLRMFMRDKSITGFYDDEVRCHRLHFLLFASAHSTCHRM